MNMSEGLAVEGELQTSILEIWDAAASGQLEDELVKP
jgi:hypothetical protein